ncbi:MAG: SUMF1/EgtB/PvdO family nonheme iron enzyme [Deltaproteobacteria bacterium]|nr:SUMF1/EgtB/PvdO family nonheme iron enzyme [Deltaproteobacteria bacterium]
MPETCGPNVDENCCTSLVVPGGTYFRSYDGVDFTDNSSPATLSTFALDRFEVNVGRFRAFVDAGMGTQASPPSAGDGLHPQIAGSGWDASWNTELPANTAALKTALECHSTYQTWTDPAGNNEGRPINCVNWYLAFAFCAWDGGRMPTEAEWNYAAAGGDEQRYYPWSAPYPPGSTTIDSTHAVYDCLGDGNVACSFADILTVGSRSPKGDGRWGHADLAGNLWEWNLDWYASYANPCNDCANLTPASDRGVRGGSFALASQPYLRAALRYHDTPDTRNTVTGFRCARTP